MNILEYIDYLISQGYSEENAEICAECMFCDTFGEGEQSPLPDDDGYFDS